VKLAWVSLVASCILWPLSLLTFAKGEPPWVISLSWLALIKTDADIIATTNVRQKQEED
jgi:hypothetical protein